MPGPHRRTVMTTAPLGGILPFGDQSADISPDLQVYFFLYSTSPERGDQHGERTRHERAERDRHHLDLSLESRSRARVSRQRAERATPRDLAETVGVTERTISAVVTDLVDSGYVRRTKEGRRNRYEVVRTRRLRHPVEGHHTIGELIATLGTAL